MKLNRILSSALIFVMLFATLITAVPLTALAAEEATVESYFADPTESEKDKSEVNKIYQAYVAKNCATAAELLAYDLDNGYLDYVKTPAYSIYVNRYTGFLYYVNNVTGQILTSNPIDPGYTTSVLDNSVLSQLEITYFALADPTEAVYTSYQWIKEGSLLKVTPVERDGKNVGISVEYTLGDVADTLIAPSALLGDSFREYLAEPILDAFATVLETYCGETDGFTAGRYTLSSYDLADHPEIVESNGEFNASQIRNAVNAILTYAEGKTNAEGYEKINAVATHVKNLFDNYNVFNPNIPGLTESDLAYMYETVPAMKNSGEAGYVVKSESVVTLTFIDRAIKECCPEYTLALAAEHEQESGYNAAAISTPSFRISIQYTLNEEGNLKVEIPTASIAFDKESYAISKITPLKYFGCGDMSNEGYAFVPDGSGAIVEFEDFYFNVQGIISPSINIQSKVYGSDYCYAYIGQSKPTEHVSMPVYGLVNQVNANAATSALASVDTVTNGFFTIIEDSDSMSTIGVTSGGGTHKYIAAYTTFAPYPSDKYDLSSTLSVGGLSAYYVVSENYYTGSCSQIYTMLSDDKVAAAAGMTDYYPSSYVGMAARYKDYLKDLGVIEAMTETSENLPLYIEALGSIDIIDKFLTFPVTVSVPLTTFEQVAMMYEQFSDCKKVFTDKAAEYRALADELEESSKGKEVEQITAYRERAEEYDALAAKYEGILNINFKLNGFTNGGMYFTYPTKVKWEKSVGGKRGFRELLDVAKDVNAKEGHNLGIYPDFDFLYINNTAAFDGIGLNRSASRMIDNRYASKQSWKSIAGLSGMYESLFAQVVTPNELDRLYSKFEKKYSKYEISNLAVSTLGSDLNSNLDEDNTVTRQEAKKYVTDLLGRMAENYSLLTEAGNIYTAQYVDHIVKATTDSSHMKYASYAIPFYGMVLHGFVNYSGSPLNYSGSPDYDFLRSIENGASLYYILCCENTNHLKEDPQLSGYYGVDYDNWFDSIIERYYALNEAIGDLQLYEIVNHTTVITERIIDTDEMLKNYVNLINEYVAAVDNIAYGKISATLTEMRINNVPATTRLNFDVDATAIAAMISDMCARVLHVTEAEYAEMTVGAEQVEALGVDAALLTPVSDGVYKLSDVVAAAISAVADKYAADYDAAVGGEITAVVEVTLTASDIVYDSVYSYVTDSVTNTDDYRYTDFTCDNGNTVSVTYSNGTDECIFLLNYNVFDVEIIVDNTFDKTLAAGETRSIVVPAYGYVSIRNSAN